MSGAQADEEDHTVREAALAALRRWHAERPWARVDPRTLALEEVLAVGPTQVILESLYERRGVRYELRAARGRPERPGEGPDPWSVTLEHPEGARLGHEVKQRLANATVHMDCTLCQSTGQMNCVRCGGTGSTDEGGSTQACFGCGGRGYVRCDTCDGAGGVLGEPTVWSVLSRHREVRTLEDLGLPMDVFFALHDGASGRDTEGDGGGLIHVQEGERVHTLQRAQGYRDDARHGASSALHRAVEKLAAEPGVTGNDRIHHQRLEVRQVPVYALILRGGESVFVYGEPLQLSPTNALRTTLGKVAHTFGWS